MTENELNQKGINGRLINHEGIASAEIYARCKSSTLQAESQMDKGSESFGKLINHVANAFAGTYMRLADVSLPDVLGLPPESQL